MLLSLLFSQLPFSLHKLTSISLIYICLFLNFLSHVCTSRMKQTQSVDKLHPIQVLLPLLSPSVTPTVPSCGPHSMIINGDENGRVGFECMTGGPPDPTFLVKKTKPAPGLLGEFESNDSFNIPENPIAHKEQKLKLLGVHSPKCIIINPIAVNDDPNQNHKYFHRIFSQTQQRD